jgi:hypothetical protein
MTPTSSPTARLDDYIEELKKEWLWFSEYETKFKDFRDKRLAHLDVSKFEDKYGPTEMGLYVRFCHSNERIASHLRSPSTKTVSSGLRNCPSR